MTTFIKEVGEHIFKDTTKRIGGKIYYMGVGGTKAVANNAAKRFRSKGWNARVMSDSIFKSSGQKRGTKVYKVWVSPPSGYKW